MVDARKTKWIHVLESLRKVCKSADTEVYV
jgi:hypothetical protein